MSNYSNRKDDERIDKIEKLVIEIHQRQMEHTLPEIVTMKKTLYGNGKPGLCDMVSRLDTKISMTAWIFGILLSVLSVLIAFFRLLNS